MQLCNNNLRLLAIVLVAKLHQAPVKNINGFYLAYEYLTESTEQD